MVIPSLVIEILQPLPEFIQLIYAGWDHFGFLDNHALDFTFKDV
jgi:hypothetical protein